MRELLIKPYFTNSLMNGTLTAADFEKSNSWMQSNQRQIIMINSLNNFVLAKQRDHMLVAFNTESKMRLILMDNH